MAVGLPLKTTYADGDVYSASDVNDTNGTINITAAPFAAGKNKIINGDFAINQRGFTSNTTTATYNFDRWRQNNAGTTGTFTTTPQTFTPGTAPIAGYEGSTFLQGITAAGASTNTLAFISQPIEDVRTFAGQTATISFFAKASTGSPKIGMEIAQNFGSGGSPSTQVLTSISAITISTSWARYSVTVSVPSISGKTIGTTANTSSLAVNFWLSAGSDFNARASSIGLQNNTFQIWGVQVEAGSTATAFQTATGTFEGELAACQRYFEVINGSAIAGTSASTTTITVGGTYKVVKRIDPTLTGLLTALPIYNAAGGYPTSTASVYSFNSIVAQGVYGFAASITGFTGLSAPNIAYVNTTTDVISASAEL
jgi:hypothetical protein